MSSFLVGAQVNFPERKWLAFGQSRSNPSNEFLGIRGDVRKMEGPVVGDLIQRGKNFRLGDLDKATNT